MQLQRVQYLNVQKIITIYENVTLRGCLGCDQQVVASEVEEMMAE